VSFEKWDEILDGQTLPVYERPHEQAWRHWAMGLAHAGKGDAASPLNRSLRSYERDRRSKNSLPNLGGCFGRCVEALKAAALSANGLLLLAEAARPC